MTRLSYSYNCNPDNWFATGYQSACGQELLDWGEILFYRGSVMGDYTARRSTGMRTFPTITPIHTHTCFLLQGWLFWVLNRSLRTYEDTIIRCRKFCLNLN